MSPEWLAALPDRVEELSARWGLELVSRSSQAETVPGWRPGRIERTRSRA